MKPLTEYQIKPVKDADGKNWVQNCYVCNKPINFRMDPMGHKWLRVMTLIRHRKCDPGYIL